MLVQENVFYLQRALRDEYLVPIRTLNHMPEIFAKNQTVDSVSFFTQDIGDLPLGTYTYRVLAVDSLNNTISSDEIKVALSSENSAVGSIHLQWGSAPGAVRYRVYGRSPSFEKMWEVGPSTSFSDYGDEASEESSTLVADGFPKPPESPPYTLFPEFTVGGERFVSPFLYRFNPTYNYYEGWLFYQELLVNFSSLEQTAEGGVSAATIPSIFINILYDSTEQLSYINVKSYQQIYDWVFEISIPELGITNEPMENTDESTATYVYSTNQGFIEGAVCVTIRGSTQGVDVFVGKTARINQRYDLSDLLQIPTFSLGGSRYLVDVPLVQKEAFEPNKTYYLDKIYDFLLGFNFEENRMVSDNLEFRFLNTDSIRSYLLTSLPTLLWQVRNLKMAR